MKQSAPKTSIPPLFSLLCIFSFLASRMGWYDKKKKREREKVFFTYKFLIRSSVGSPGCCFSCGRHSVGWLSCGVCVILEEDLLRAQFLDMRRLLH